MIALDTQTLAKAWFYQFSWGFSTVPATGTADERDAEMLVYAQSLCNAIAADGKASDTEIAWVQGYLANKGFGNLVHEVEAMAKAAESKTIDQMVADTKKAMDVGSLKFAGPAVIFDSIRAAMVDGLDDKHRCHGRCFRPVRREGRGAQGARHGGGGLQGQESPHRYPRAPLPRCEVPVSACAGPVTVRNRQHASAWPLGEKLAHPVWCLFWALVSSKFSQGKIVV